MGRIGVGMIATSTRLALLGLLPVAFMFAFGDRAAAAPKASTARAALVADSGFRPPADGYSFANYLNVAARPNLGVDEMRRLFGDGVCAAAVGRVCVLSPPALAWMQQQNAAMANGHCFGFSVTALLFWARLISPSQFGARAVPRLSIAGNQLLSREIAYGYAFQLLASVIGAEVSSSPNAVLSALRSGLGRNGPLFTLGVVDQFGDGHAITPYAVKRIRPGRYAILVYDNNLPGRTRQVLVNTKANTWSYEAAVNPRAPVTLYAGDASTHSLFLLPARPGLGVQPCPFCSPVGLPTIASAASVHRSSRRALQTVRLTAPGSVLAHLLITNRRGQRIGFVPGREADERGHPVDGRRRQVIERGRLVNEIPGARIVRVFADGPQAGRERNEPEYEIPIGQPYRIELVEGDFDGDFDNDGRTTPRARPTLTAQSVTVLEPGVVAAAQDVVIGRGQRATLRLGADGHTLSFVGARGGREPMLMVGDARPGADDYQWNVRNAAASAGRPTTVSLDATKHLMRLGPGRYDLSMDLVRDTVAVFAHNQFTLPRGATAVVAYGSWKPGDPMPVTVYSHGTTHSELLCDQQVNAAAGQLSPSSPAYPPANPAGCSASAQTSPSSVAFGDVAFAQQNVATRSAPQTVTLSNTGTTSLNVGSVSIGGANPGDFAVSSDGCSGQKLAPGSSCTVQVTFDPSSTGDRSASLTFADTATSSPQIVALSGVGIGIPGASVSPASVSFGLDDERSSDPKTVTLRSTGTAPLRISAVTIGGANPDSFIKRQDGCSGNTLDPGDSCTVQVAFVASGDRSRSATLTFTDNAPDTPQTITLSGTCAHDDDDD
jgi:hypothetical protein